MGKAIDYCIENNVLKNFLEYHSKEARNMLTAERDMDTALQVRGEEAARQKALMVARALIAKGIDVDTIAEATGLTVDDVLRLK